MYSILFYATLFYQHAVSNFILSDIIVSEYNIENKNWKIDYPFGYEKINNEERNKCIYYLIKNNNDTIFNPINNKLNLNDTFNLYFKYLDYKFYIKNINNYICKDKLTDLLIIIELNKSAQNDQYAIWSNRFEKSCGGDMVFYISSNYEDTSSNNLDFTERIRPNVIEFSNKTE